MPPYIDGMNEKTGWRARAIAMMSEGGPWGGRGSGGGDGSGGGSSGGGDGGGPKSPWSQPPGGGKPRGPRGNSAVDQLAKQLQDRFGGGLPGGGNRTLIRNVLIGVVLIWIAFTSTHQIEPQQEGVVTRFGKYVGRLEPGIGLTLPSPIESVEKVDVRAINTTGIPDGDGVNLVLTGDQNIVDLAYSIRWDKTNPEFYLFELANPDDTIREAGESAMREVIGQVTLSDAFGRGRGHIESEVTRRTQQLLNAYHAGVTIRGVSIRHVKPPEDVVEAFNQVTVKQQQMQGNINNANTYKKQVVAKAQGEAAAFDKVYEQYRLAPGVTRRRMYYDTMESVLANTDKTIVEPTGIAPFLPLRGSTPRVTVEEPR
jgi:modulator of FtsH protease HflK